MEEIRAKMLEKKTTLETNLIAMVIGCCIWPHARDTRGQYVGKKQEQLQIESFKQLSRYQKEDMRPQDSST